MSPHLFFTAPTFPGLRPILPTLAALSTLLSGCISTKYKMAREGTPPPVPLNLVATQPPVEAVLNTVIIYQGPGSWKRAAFWDEYIVTVSNQGTEALAIASVELADPAGAFCSPGSDPWVLEKQSKTLEQKYRDAGMAFVRNAGAGVVILGTGVGGVAVAGGIFSAGAGAVAATTLVALPVYYVTVALINHSNKAAVVAEFNRRRMVLPLTLGPGETRTASLFFPMVPSPRSLSLHWTSGPSRGETLFSLAALEGLHVKAPVAAAVRN